VCTCPHPDDLEQDLDLLHRYSARVRTYSAECPELLSMLGHYLAATAPPGVGGGAGGGGAWFLGVWLGPSDAANQQQLRRLAQLLETNPEASR
jgi:exo-beta-1,3-glucanase (GH17 family)